MRLRINVGVMLVAGACGGGSDGGVVAPPGNGPASVTVTLTADRFTPDSTTVRVGGTVVFSNPSGVLHDVDFGTPSLHLAAFDAGTRTLTFPTAGTLHYFCNIHAGMEATLVVR